MKTGGSKLWKWSYSYDGKQKTMHFGTYLPNRAGYHGHHMPHGFRTAFSTIMNEWAERDGKGHDRKVIDLMLAHVPKEKVEGVYDREVHMPRRRELAYVWADMLSDQSFRSATLGTTREIGALFPLNQLPMQPDRRFATPSGRGLPDQRDQC